MTRAIRSINKGRARVWWIHHGQEAKNAAYLVAIVAIFLTVSHFDYADQVAQAEADRDNVAKQLREERAARGLPRTTFVIEAATASDAQSKLAQIAGDADTMRYQLRVK